MTDELTFRYRHVGRGVPAVEEVPPDRAAFYNPVPYPMVPVRLFRPDGELATLEWAVVDSGADTSVFPDSWLDALAIPRDACRPEGPPGLYGRTPVQPLVYDPGVDAELAGHRLKLAGYFAPTPPEA